MEMFFSSVLGVRIVTWVGNNKKLCVLYTDGSTGAIGLTYDRLDNYLGNVNDKLNNLINAGIELQAESYK